MKYIGRLLFATIFVNILIGQQLINYKSTGNLISDWNNATQNIKDELWIGYSINSLDDKGIFIGSFDFDHNDYSMKDILSGKIKYSDAFHSSKRKNNRMYIHGCISDDRKKDDKIAVLLRIKKGKSNIRVSEICIFNFAYSIDFKNYDLIWLGHYSTEASSEFAIEQFQKEDPDLQEDIIPIIGLTKNSTVTDFMAEQIKNNDFVEIRERFAFWMGKQDNDKAFQTLKYVVFNDEDKDVQEAAVSGLSQIKIKKANDLLMEIVDKHKNEDVQEAAIFWLGQKSDKSIVKYLAEIAWSNRSEDLREKAVFSLGQSDYSEALDEIIKLAYKAKSKEIRESAIFALGQKASKKAVAELKNIVDNNPDTEIKKSALFALAHNGDEEDIKYFVELAKSHSSKQIRKHAIFCLGQYDSKEAVDALVKILER